MPILSPEESTQPHLVVPIGRESGDITLNVKTILFALALFAGGGIGGGGLSLFAHNGSDAVNKDTVDQIKSQVTAMQGQLVEMNKTILEMSGDLKNDAVEHKRTDDELSDHESRIRTIERKMR